MSRSDAVPESVEQTRKKAAEAPDPEDPRKPDHPLELRKPTVKYILKRALSEFSKDHVTDLAASLTYFAMLSLFPMLLAVVSTLGVFGQGEATAQGLNEWIDRYAPGDLSSLLSETISGLASQGGAGLAMVTGLLGALWAASGYVGAFSRAMNRIYEVEEGRPIWKFRPTMLLITLALLLIITAIVFSLMLSGPVAESVGNLIGLGSTGVLVWNILKWPLVLVLAVLAIAILYYFTPNVKQPKFRWISMGAVAALGAAAIAVLVFSIYVANFGSYNATYGIIGSVIVLLLGIWIVNNVLLLGAEIDAEVERARQLQGGFEAEETIKLPPRGTKASEKVAAKQDKLVEEGRELRETYGGDQPENDDAEPSGATRSDQR